MSTDPSEAARRALEAFQAENPDLDLTHLLAGTLAGPASSERPPVPVWDYIAYADSNEHISLDDLDGVRFPIRMYGGELTITSIAEWISLLSGGNYPPPLVSDVIRMFEMKYQAGLYQWDASSRGIKEVLDSRLHSPNIMVNWIEETYGPSGRSFSSGFADT